MTRRIQIDDKFFDWDERGITGLQVLELVDRVEYKSYGFADKLLAWKVNILFASGRREPMDPNLRFNFDRPVQRFETAPIQCMEG